MKKLLSLLLLIMILVLSSCTTIPTTTTEKPIDEDILVSRVNETKSGRKYIEVDGNPFVYNGVQIRTDWLIDVEKESIDDLDHYFKKAKELSVNMVEIPVQWKDVEPKEGAYDFRNLFKIISMAKKYDLRVELLIFTVNITGMTGCVPSYIRNNPELYPQYENDLNHPDALFFHQDNPNILEKEGKMVEALMDAIYKWSKDNDSNTVISIQVRNEPDLYFKRIEEHNIKYNGDLVTREHALNEMLNATDYIAKIVKESKYKVITRVNLCCFVDHPEESYLNWKAFTDLESIDFIGEDTYNSKIDFNKNIILDMHSKIKTYPQIAENTGNYLNNASLILMSNILGAGYNLYDLITPSIIVNDWGYYDWGILDNKTKEGKETFSNTSKMLRGINLAGPYTVITRMEDFAGFNLTTNNPKDEIEMVVNTSKTTYTFRTSSKAVGYALNVNDYIYIFATDSYEIEFSNTTIDNIYESGYVEIDGTFIKEESFESNSNTLSLEGNKLYRFKATSLGDLVSNTVENIHSDIN